MTPDDVLSMIKAAEDVITAEQMLTTGCSQYQEIQMLRKSVLTLAVIQRDFLKGLIQ